MLGLTKAWYGNYNNQVTELSGGESGADITTLSCDKSGYTTLSSSTVYLNNKYTKFGILFDSYSAGTASGSYMITSGIIYKVFTCNLGSTHQIDSRTYSIFYFKNTTNGGISFYNTYPNSEIEIELRFNCVIIGIS